MIRLKHILVALCLGCIICGHASMPVWEQITPLQQTYDNEDADKIEVTVRDGYIYISTARPVTVKVMSIVGQMISQQNVPAGVSRLKVTARGIYILKAGTFTMRVTV